MEKEKRKLIKTDKVVMSKQTCGIRSKKLKNHTSGKKSQTDITNAVYWLKKIAESGGIQSINDPVLWQKNIRKDHSFSGD